MSWASGSMLMDGIIETIDDLVPNYQTRVEIYKRMIELFEDEDCDVLEECIESSPAFQEAYNSVHPSHEYLADFDEDYDD